jgi:lipopolysaccharide transport system ATP-binding protein
MQSIATHGTTVLYVSHDMSGVAKLCEKAILLSEGRVLEQGRTRDVINYYLSADGRRPGSVSWGSPLHSPGDDQARLKAVRVLGPNRGPTDTVEIDKGFTIEVEYWSLRPGGRVAVILQFFNHDGVCLFASNDFTNHNWYQTPRERGVVQARCQIPAHLLAEGQVNLLVALGTYNPNVVHALEKDLISFYVVDRTTGTGVRGPYAGDWPGVMRPMLDWAVEQHAGPDGERP